jgi:hypothetical protein
MSNRNTRAAVLIAVVFLATGITAITAIASATSTIVQLAYGKAFLPSILQSQLATERQAPIATSGDNLCIVCWFNKTGNNEVMFKASADGGKTFGDKINLSNASDTESVNAEIAASGSNVYVSWWERNTTSNEPSCE